MMTPYEEIGDVNALTFGQKDNSLTNSDSKVTSKSNVNSSNKNSAKQNDNVKSQSKIMNYQ